MIKELKDRGYWVRALARNEKKLGEQGKFLEPAVLDIVDEVFTGEVTDPETLKGVCKDIDYVYSSLGITRQTGKLTYWDVDYQGNVNILNEAKKESVSKFVFVSVLNGHKLTHLDVVKTRETFIEDVRKSDIPLTVVRPSGFFSDISALLDMAKKGSVMMMGKEDYKLNPIHGADLAKVCVDAMESEEDEILVGGPDIFTQDDIAKIAFEALGKPVKTKRVSIGLLTLIVKLTRPFNRNSANGLEFAKEAVQVVGTGPQIGDHHLKDYFDELVKAGNGPS